MKNIILFGSAIAILFKPDSSNMNYLIDTEFTLIDKSLDQSFEQAHEQTSTENDTNTPGFSLFVALSVLLITVYLIQKKK